MIVALAGTGIAVALLGALFFISRVTRERRS